MQKIAVETIKELWFGDGQNTKTDEREHFAGLKILISFAADPLFQHVLKTVCGWRKPAGTLRLILNARLFARLAPLALATASCLSP